MGRAEPSSAQVSVQKTDANLGHQDQAGTDWPFTGLDLAVSSGADMPPRVFISYTHDTQEHMDRVWDLSEKLRLDGVDCRIDQHEESPAEGWPRWCRNQVQESQFVLIGCTETYQRRYEGKEEAGKGLGGQWEGFVITQELYEAEAKNTKFIPIVFSSVDSEYIPIELRAATRYELSTPEGYDKLFRRATGQPARAPSLIAPTVKTMSPMASLERKSPSPPSPKQLFTVPLLENPFFTGREEVLHELKKTLDRSGIAALTGLGGMGKTQTAAQYAHHHRQHYPWVLWVRAQSADTLFADLSPLAGRLALPEREAKEQSVIVEAVLRWLDEQERWLLVLDNVEDYSVVRDLSRKASANGHHVIITTQTQALGAIGRQKLLPMEQEQGAALLLRRANRLSADAPLSNADPGEAALAREISREVGGLPLALDQAGAYLEETGCGLQDYLTLLRQRFNELAERRGGLDADHVSVAATYLTSFEKLAKVNPAAAELLKAAAFLPPDAIPEEIFTQAAAKFGPVLQEAASDSLKWNDAISAAFKFSLLERDTAKKALAIHRMVQAVARSRMSTEESAQWAGEVVGAVNAAFPGVEFADWEKCERLVPSAQACAALVDEYGLSSPEAALLLNATGYYLDDRARYKEAELLYRRSLAISESTYGPDHTNVATHLNNLATLLNATNRLAEAEPLYRRALAIWEEALEPNHPQVAIGLNNLALLLQATNRLAEAEPLMRRALAIDEKAFGPDHPKVATRLANLAALLKETNRLGEAEPLMRRALEIDERAYGPDHPDVAIELNNLAQLLQATNRLGEAEPLMRRALEIDERAYGPDHPDVAIGLNNLSGLLQGTNRLGEAEPLYRRALAIVEKSLGRDHPRTVTVRENLDVLLRQMGKVEDAGKL